MSPEETEEASRERSSAFAASILDASPIGTALVGADLRCVQINPAFAALGGVAAGAAPGRALGEVAPRLAAQLEPLLRATLDTGLCFSNVEIMEAGSAPARSWHASTFIVRDALLSGPAVGVMVTARAPSQEDPALRDREAVFRSIFERAAIGMAVFEWRGKALRFNPAFCEMLGYSQEDLARFGIQGITHPEDYAADLELFRRLMAGEIDSYTLPKRYIHKRGHVLWGQLVVSISRDPDGQPSLLISMVEDVTERRRAEDENERLIHELEEAVSARDLFVTVASHELRTPLTALLLNLQILQRKAADGPLAPGVEKALLAARRLMSLVERLLDLSRIKTGVMAPQTAELDLRVVTRDAVERFRPAAALSGCSLTLAAPEPVPVHADLAQIDAVIDNLLANAAKFGAHKPIEIAVGRRDGVARLSVRDHGIGVAPEDRERIFERFARAVSERRYGGLGIGLYVARWIVEAHGARIWVESEPGEGAEFIVELPCRER